ncbi:spindle and kinetochore-associated protein 1-like [Culicoides brevitarsis]|uniref:spindle and kinetochore-associated protein 1-like n=1 Tax=Culicoides brevitarsis TaxID=469753 RepID=UPI00307BD791
MDQKMEKLCRSLDLIEKQAVVLQEKQQNIEKLIKLDEITKEARANLDLIHKNLTSNIDELKKTCSQIKKRVGVLQLQMLYLLEKVDAVQINSKPVTKVLQPNTNYGNFSPNVSNLPVSKIAISDTPMRMRVTDYENSPFISRRQPMQLQFIDFEAQVTHEDFAGIPSYMKGRESLEELRAFLDQIVISCFTEKYTLMCKKRDAIRNPHDIEIWKIYKQQKDDFPGKYFVTEGDIARKIGRLVDKKMNCKLQMLRHLGIIKEVRKVKTVYYIWNL